MELSASNACDADVAVVAESAVIELSDCNA